MLEAISDALIIPFDAPRRKLPTRERHFNTGVAVVGALLLAHVPLFMSTVREVGDGTVTYYVRGTLMHLGTQPFAVAHMAAMFLDADDRKHTTALGLLTAVAMAAQWTFATGEYWICGAQLALVALGMAQVMSWLEHRGSASLSTALIFVHAAERMVGALFSWSALFAAILVGVVSWLDGLAVTVPLNHTRRRTQPLSQELPVMYNSTTALIMYSTLTEILGALYAPAHALRHPIYGAPVLFGAVWAINKQLPELHETSGRQLVRAWKKNQLAVKGWRDTGAMTAYVQRLIDRNVWWNTVILCSLWFAAAVFRPAITPTTIFILTATAKQHVTSVR